MRADFDQPAFPMLPLVAIAAVLTSAALSSVPAMAQAPAGGTQLVASFSPSPFDLAHKPVERIEPGVVIGQQQQAGYSNLVTLVLPRLSSGHLDSLPDYAKRYAAMFKLAIMANVVKHEAQGRAVYSLDKVRLGFSMDINGKMTIVTKATANQLGANLGMIDRSVLGGNEDCLNDVIQVARNNRLIVFDAKANMLVGDDHEERVIRHFIWVSSTTGKLGFLVWQLNETGTDRYAIDSPAMQLLPPGYKEDRQIHVSAGGFLSSIPTPSRFAVVKIPQGKAIPFTAKTRQVAGAKNLTAKDLAALVSGVSEAFAQTANQQPNQFR